MPITIKAEHDPVGDFPFLNAYMRWALLATEEIAGKPGLHIVLREAGLERLIDNFPPDDFQRTAGLTNRDYTAFCTGLLNFFGRAGRGGLLRIGRRSTQLALDRQLAALGLGTLVAAAKVLPAGLRLKAGLEFNVSVFTRIYKEGGATWRAHIEDRGQKWGYVMETCGLCVERQAEAPICTVFSGTLMESVAWLMGKEYEVQEVACHAMGAPACVWEISKTPKAP